MYRVYLERAAERDLKQLSAKLHDRVIAAIQALAKAPRPARIFALGIGESANMGVLAGLSSGANSATRSSSNAKCKRRAPA